MNEHEFERAFRAWSRSEAAEPASAELRARTLAVPLTTPGQRGDLPSSTGRLRSMLGATRLVAAGAIVALFGGLLLAGSVIRPGHERAFVGASASTLATARPTASPGETSVATRVRSDLLPGVDLVTEEVEPGVYRVLSDGVRQLALRIAGGGFAQLNAMLGSSVAVGPDGSVWLFWDDLASFRLGDQVVTRWGDHDRTTGEWDVEVAPDGTVYGPGSGDALALIPGEGWTDLGRPIWDFAIGPDGVAWAIGPPVAGCPPARTGRACDTVVMTIEGPSFHPKRVSRVPGIVMHDIWVTPDGEIWLWHDKGLARLDGTDIERLGGPSQAWPMDAMTADGTLWIGDHGTPLYRYDGVDWTAYEHDDIGLPKPRGLFDSNPFDLAAGADGSVWIAYGCDQLTHFDGTTATALLDGLCVFDLAGAPDGSVWLLAAPHPAPAEDRSRVPETLGLYLVTPEALGAHR